MASTIRVSVCLRECAGTVREYVKRALERSMDRLFGETLDALSLTILGYTYDAGKVKQPDTSYVPSTMPNPTRVNAIKLDPLTGQAFRLVGEPRIPTDLIFGTAIVPPNLPTHHTLSFEEVRKWVDAGTNRAGLYGIDEYQVR
jgi:hypothetical protein